MDLVEIRLLRIVAQTQKIRHLTAYLELSY